MSDKINVSVIVPVYNVAPFLSKCLDSLVNQTLKEIEFIVIDDGSSDHSWEIIQSYEMNYPNLIHAYHKKNGGLSSARNYGIPFAKGEFIGFVDSDDWIERNMFECLYHKAKETDTKLVICNFQEEDDTCAVPFLVTKQKNIENHVTPAWNKLYHASYFQHLKYTEGIRYEDLNMLMKLLPQVPLTDISFCDDILYHYRKTADSIMNRPNAQKNLDMIKVFDDAMHYWSEIQTDFDVDAFIKQLWLEHVTITTITRLIKQKDDKTKYVVRQLNDYAKLHLQGLFQCGYFKQLPFKRKVIAFLNGHNLIHISVMLMKKQ